MSDDARTPTGTCHYCERTMPLNDLARCGGLDVCRNGYACHRANDARLARGAARAPSPEDPREGPMCCADARRALALLWREVVDSGNGRATNDGWPEARRATLAVLGPDAYTGEILRIEAVPGALAWRKGTTK